MDQLGSSLVLHEEGGQRPDGSPALPSSIREISLRRQPRVWAVGGGKGGVGKSLICANFALSLSQRGHHVVAIDLDLGGANLHTCLGLEPPKSGIGDWIVGRVEKLEDAMVPVGTLGTLKIISGSNDPAQITNLFNVRRAELSKLIRQIDADDVVIDLGAGTHDYTIDLFNLADQGILSILPEPTSVENAYRFIKAVFYRKLQEADIGPGIREVIDAAMDQKNILGIRTPSDLFAIIDRLDVEAGRRLRAQVGILQPAIVINQVRSQVDIDVGKAICSVCRRYFGIDVRYPGYIDYDNAVWKAVRSKKPVIQEFPHSVLATRIEHLTRALLGESQGLIP